MFLWTNNKIINNFGWKKVSYLELCTCKNNQAYIDAVRVLKTHIFNTLHAG